MEMLSRPRKLNLIKAIQYINEDANNKAQLYRGIDVLIISQLCNIVN